MRCRANRPSSGTYQVVLRPSGGWVDEARDLVRSLTPSDLAHRRWLRQSEHPVYQQQRQAQLIGPLAEHGLLPRPGAANDPGASGNAIGVAPRRG